ncbi:MAG: Vitamin B12 import ATP-binding protein BtuD [Candidatus Celerinatantimonas neptuna]|nr:MAG: Vitamin B12 import ATP-binding protein BtuD [Candidatus Celerinatantimonas neptuna]
MIKIDQLQVRDYLKIDHLEIDSGKIIAVCGPNGSRKLTLLEALAGFLPLQRGQVFLSGKRLADYSISELAKFRSWLAQQPPHRAYLSVSEQLHLEAK